MAAHRFGIMNRAPRFAENFYRFDTDICDGLLEVEEELLEPIITEMCRIDFYCQTLGVICKGLNLSGCTLMPPVSIGALIDIARKEDELKDFCELLNKAYLENKYIIHFGI